jgi:hypothetical protein
MMKYLGNNNLARTILSLLAVGIMSFGVLSIVTMNHEMGMTGASPLISQSNNCSDSHEAESCISFHLGIMQNLSSATGSNLSPQLMSLLFLLVSFIGFLVFALFKILGYYYIRHRIRLRQLYEKTITAFARQLGYWLTLFEKRDPSYVFVMA